jgi:hypothetical protein
MAEARAIDVRHLPDLEWEVGRPFWEGCRAGELRIPKCQDCGRLVWYPASTCPECGGGRHEWTRVSGRGRLFTWVTVYRAFLPGFEQRVPFVTALVELEEDPRVRLATFLRDAPASGLTIGLPVEVVFDEVEEGARLPMFRPQRP